jgi:hypothetical protein
MHWQHVTQYESIIDTTETWLEKWLLHEANEVYNYYSCVEYEQNSRIKQIWERFLDYELGHLRFCSRTWRSTMLLRSWSKPVLPLSGMKATARLSVMSSVAGSI